MRSHMPLLRHLAPRFRCLARRLRRAWPDSCLAACSKAPPQSQRGHATPVTLFSLIIKRKIPILHHKDVNHHHHENILILQMTKLRLSLHYLFGRNHKIRNWCKSYPNLTLPYSTSRAFNFFAIPFHPNNVQL